MKALLASAAVAAAVLVSAPAAAADFAGPRVGVHVGIAGDDLGSRIGGETFGIEAGYDMPISDASRFGVAVEYQNDFGDDFGRELSATARFGTRFASDNALFYVAGGYTNLSGGGEDLDGARIGAGLEYAVGDSGLSLKVEQRYADYEQDLEAFQTVAGVAFRF